MTESQVPPNIKSNQSPQRDKWILLAFWLLSCAISLIWLHQDQRVPAWDQGRILIGTVDYWWTLQHPDWFSSVWWERFWMLSSKYPPVLFSLAALWQRLLGTGMDQVTSLNLLFQGILIASTYGLGRIFFNRRIGLWAAALVLLFPKLYVLNLEALFDYPLVAMVTATFWSLSYWRSRTNRWVDWRWSGWRWAIATGVLLGLTILTKQPAVLFFVVPFGWLLIARFRARQWEALVQLLVMLLIAGLLIFPWVRTNWIFLISSWQNANVGPAALEGDPPLTSLAAWFYYLRGLPALVSWPLLLIPIVGALLARLKVLRPSMRERQEWREQDSTPAPPEPTNRSKPRNLLWLVGFCGGAYLLWSAVMNKDLRYVTPYLPAIAILLALALQCWPRRYLWVRFGVVLLAYIFLLNNLLGVGGPTLGWFAKRLAREGVHHVIPEVNGPQAEIVQDILRRSPYQLTNVGVLPTAAWLNEFNLNYTGALEDFQVYARGLGRSDRQRELDFRNTDWFVSLTNAELDRKPESELDAAQRSGRLLAADPNFQVEQTWEFWQDPHLQQVTLYRRQQFPIAVETLLASQDFTTPVQLQHVQVPQTAPPGQPIPVTYVWSGTWENLRQGNVLLTWHPQAALESEADVEAESTTNPAPPLATNAFWLHDHGIGLGRLRPGPIEANQFVLSPAIVDDRRWFKVTERTAMQPPNDLEAGVYTLTADYLDPESGDRIPLEVPAVSITIDPATEPTPAPPVDYVSRVRELAKLMPEGVPALETVFAELDRLNLYDPIQNFYVQAERTLTARLQQAPDQVDYAYGVLLSQALQREVNAALESLETITALDADNPYSHAYQAFVNLAAWRPGAAKQALDAALDLAPDSAEIHGLDAIANLMQGNLWGAWQQAQVARDLAQS
ncbi:MAG: glycosyltransferase family 39 protein [Cyanobacteria bacterium P01_H01_bin.121]